MRKTQDKKSSNLTLTVIQKDGNIYFTASAKAVIRQKKDVEEKKKAVDKRCNRWYDIRVAAKNSRHLDN